jgi:hypothetical protein
MHATATVAVGVRAYGQSAFSRDAGSKNPSTLDVFSYSALSVEALEATYQYFHPKYIVLQTTLVR